MTSLRLRTLAIRATDQRVAVTQTTTDGGCATFTVVDERTPEERLGDLIEAHLASMSPEQADRCIEAALGILAKHKAT